MSITAVVLIVAVFCAVIGRARARRRVAMMGHLLFGTALAVVLYQVISGILT